MFTKQNKRKLFLYLAPVFILIFGFFISSYPPIKAHADNTGAGSVSVSGVPASCTGTNCSVTVTVSGDSGATSGSTTFYVTGTSSATPGACGSSATTYSSTDTSFTGSLCSAGNPINPTNPSFPAAGSSSTWTCSGSGGGFNSSTCTATRSASAGPGVCGSSATSYPASATDFTGSFCQAGSPIENSVLFPTLFNPGTPNFPQQGNSSTWYCTGATGYSNSSACTATRSAIPTAVGTMSADPSSCTLPCTDGSMLTWSSTGATTPDVWVNGSEMTTGASGSQNIPSSWISTTPLNFSLVDDATGRTLATATVTGQNPGCGTANQSYANGTTSYGSDTFCASGTSNPSSPTFPSAGSSTTWTCPGGISCTASQAAPVANCTPGNQRLCSSATANSCGQYGSGQEICGANSQWGACSAVTPSSASCTPTQGTCSINVSPASGTSPATINLNVNNSVPPFYNSYTLQDGQHGCGQYGPGTGCIYGTQFSCQAYDSYGHAFNPVGNSTISVSTPGVDTFRMTCGSTSDPTFWSWAGTVAPSPFSCSNFVSVTASPNGVCGTANGKTYAYTDSSFGSDTICAVNGPVSTPTFPASGNSVSWTCEGTDQGSNASCSASRAGSPTDPSGILTANPTSVYTGESSTITWSSANATACTSATIPNFPITNTTSGSVTVTPASTTTYSLTCTGATGSGTGSATVTVKHKPGFIEN